MKNIPSISLSSDLKTSIRNSLLFNLCMFSSLFNGFGVLAETLDIMLLLLFDVYYHLNFSLWK